MNIEPNLNVHSVILTKFMDDIETLRKRTHDINQKIAVQSYSISEHGKLLMDTVGMIKENREIIEKLNIEMYSKRSILEFIGDKLMSPKTLMTGVIFLIIFESIAIMPVILKHIFGW